MASVTSVARRVGTIALDLLFPPQCVLCRRHGAFLCAGCTATLTPAEPPRCSLCWQPGNRDRCLDCTTEPPAFEGLRAACAYDGPARELVHALKYRGMTAVAAPMASLLAATAHRRQIVGDLVVPVPLAGLRRRLRGYNQAEALARPLARDLGRPLETRALARRRGAPPQARSADAQARRRNVAGAFACRPTGIEGRRVLLVDDVATTGATLDACARALKEAGASSVWALTFARED